MLLSDKSNKVRVEIFSKAVGNPLNPLLGSRNIRKQCKSTNELSPISRRMLFPADISSAFLVVCNTTSGIACSPELPISIRFSSAGRLAAYK